MSTETHGVPNDTIHEAIQFLSARCDGAREDDGVGFRAQDTAFGKRLATIPLDAWSPEMREEALRVLGMYVNTQLPEAFEEEVITLVREGATQARKRLDARRQAASLARAREADDHTVLVTETQGGYLVALHVRQAAQRQALKDATRARWRADAKVWFVEADQADALLAWCDEHADEWPEGLVQAAESAAETRAEREEAALQVRVSLAGEATLLWEWNPFTHPQGWPIKDAVKALVGSTFHADTKRWTTDAHPGALSLAERFDGVVFTPEAQAAIAGREERLSAAERERETLAEMSHAAEATGVVDVAMTEHLYPFQVAGVEYAVTKRRVLIGDEMGLGKTRQAIATLVTTEALPALVVCPTSLRGNWRREVEMLTDLTVAELTGRKPTEVPEADVLVIGYDVLTAWEPLLTDLRALVLDESHYVKNKSQRSAAAMRLSKRIPDDGVVVLLSGTPIENRPLELLRQLQVLGTLKDVAPEPRRGRSDRDWEFSYKFRYCGPEENKYGWTFQGKSHTDELGERLRSSCMVRRLKKNVLTDLPPILPENLTWLSLNGALREYRKAEADIIAFAREHGGAEAAWKAARAEVLVQMSTLRRLVGEAKVQAAQEWVLNWLDSNPDESLVVFANHIPVQEAIIAALDEAGVKTSRILGGQRDVEAQKSAFQAGETRVIVCSLKAAKEGHTLTRASNVLLIEQDWTPSAHAQAVARCHRPGQTQDVQPWFLLGEGTVDDHLRSVLAEKSRTVASVLDGVSDDEDEDEESMVEKVFAALVG